MKVLITGGTGLIGTEITQILLEKGYEVAYLSRSKKKDKHVQYYQWDIAKSYIEEGAISSADYIIHLAGAGVADKKWTDERKKELLESRTQSTALLTQKLAEGNHQVKAVIMAVAIGIYGDSGSDNWVDEETKDYGDDFLAQVCKEWETAGDKLAQNGIALSKIRVGVVLSDKGGALVEIAKPVKLFAGAPLASGKQMMSWIHIRDMANIFVFALENQLEGTFNGVAPHPATNEELTKTTAKVLGKPLFLPNVPEFALKLMLGEMAQIVIAGSKISSKKIENTGFEFQYPALEKAVKNLLK